MNHDYASLRHRAPARLAILRANAAALALSNKGPISWRNVRYATLKSETGFQSAQQRRTATIAYTNDDMDSWGMRWTWADKVEGVGRSIDHTGWYQDADGCMGTLRGFVIQLPHGRFLSGYHDNEHGQSTIEYGVVDCERSAAYRADQLAEQAGQEECEHRAKADEARAALEEEETMLKRLRELLVMRHVQCLSYARAEALDVIERLRELRKDLSTVHAEYL